MLLGTTSNSDEEPLPPVHRIAGNRRRKCKLSPRKVPQVTGARHTAIDYNSKDELSAAQALHGLDFVVGLEPDFEAPPEQWSSRLHSNTPWGPKLRTIGSSFSFAFYDFD